MFCRFRLAGAVDWGWHYNEASEYNVQYLRAIHLGCAELVRLTHRPYYYYLIKIEGLGPTWIVVADYTMDLTEVQEDIILFQVRRQQGQVGQISCFAQASLYM